MKKHKFVNKKWIVILLIVGLLITFDMLDDQKSISTRAIVLAMSLDEGEEGKYELGIQLLKTDKSNKQDYINFFEQGDSISEILEKMNYNVGATVSLAHTMVIVISRDLLKSDEDKALRYFLENQIVSYNTMLVTSKEKPKEILSQKLSNDIGSGYYLGQILRTVAGDCGVVPVSIKDYFMHRYRIGECVYMPYVCLLKEGETDYIGITQMYATDGQREALLSEKASKGLSLVVSDLANGSLTYSYENIMGEADIVQSSSFISVSGNTAKITIDATLRDTSNVPDSINEKACLEDINATIKSYIGECYETCKKQGLDIYNLGQYFYAYQNPAYTLPDYLDEITLDIKIDSNLK